jgi:hypothetical protein
MPSAVSVAGYRETGRVTAAWHKAICRQLCWKIAVAERLSLRTDGLTTRTGMALFQLTFIVQPA